MDEGRFQLIKTVAFLLSFALVFAAQTLAPYRRAGRLVTKNWRQNVPLSVLNTIVMSLVCGTCVCAAARYSESRGLGLFPRVGVPPWAGIAGTIVALDFALWGWHLANHRLAWLWRFHRVHHSDVDFDISTSLRFHAGELLLSLPLRLAAVFLLGAPLAGLLAFEVVFGLFNMFVHGNIRMASAVESRLSAIVILPAAHRLHHSVRPDQRGRNFGTILSAWDRWLGTWTEGRSAETVTTGLQDLIGISGLPFWRCLSLPFEPQATGPGNRRM
jgi:sterol desaturase/sphingolipid hydroxylase (fatty acid hydroxylase superfamily)